MLSIIIVAIVFVTGGRLTGPAIRRLAQDDDLWTRQSAAAARRRDALSRRLVIGVRGELGGILVVLGLMVVPGVRLELTRPCGHRCLSLPPSVRQCPPMSAIRAHSSG
jgi:hypothetical protein